MRQTFLDGWVLRFSRGFSKRSNSIIPLYPSPLSLFNHSGEAEPKQDASDPYTNRSQTLLQKIRYCENMYAREQLQTIFRLTSLHHLHPQIQHLDTVLAQRGYQHVEPSQVLHKSLSVAPAELTGPGLQWQLLPLDQWLLAYCQLTGMAEPASSLHRIILNSIAGECGFVLLLADDQPVACGLGVIEQDLVGLFDIYTDQQQRGHGYGRAVVNQLLRWAVEQGAEHAYLQVLEANTPALTLYQTMDFKHLYQYWYRCAA